MNKPLLREQLKKQRDGLDPDLRLAWDEQIHHHLLTNPQYGSAATIMLYLSFGSEINTWPLFFQALKDGKKVVIPKVCKYPQEIIAVEVAGQADLELSFWGIYEPQSNEPFAPGLIDLIIVPGLAFDPHGYRIGYGGGYYDRFLPQVFGLKVGLCYPPFLREIPLSPWDQPVDQVILP